MAAVSSWATCKGRFGDQHQSLVLSEIEDKDAIYESIKTFLGKGR